MKLRVLPLLTLLLFVLPIKAQEIEQTPEVKLVTAFTERTMSFGKDRNKDLKAFIAPSSLARVGANEKTEITGVFKPKGYKILSQDSSMVAVEVWGSAWRYRLYYNTVKENDNYYIEPHPNKELSKYNQLSPNYKRDDYNAKVRKWFIGSEPEKMSKVYTGKPAVSSSKPVKKDNTPSALDAVAYRLTEAAETKGQLESVGGKVVVSKRWDWNSKNTQKFTCFRLGYKYVINLVNANTTGEARLLYNNKLWPTKSVWTSKLIPAQKTNYRQFILQIAADEVPENGVLTLKYEKGGPAYSLGGMSHTVIYEIPATRAELETSIYMSTYENEVEDYARYLATDPILVAGLAKQGINVVKHTQKHVTASCEVSFTGLTRDKSYVVYVMPDSRQPLTPSFRKSIGRTLISKNEQIEEDIKTKNYTIKKFTMPLSGFEVPENGELTVCFPGSGHVILMEKKKE